MNRSRVRPRVAAAFGLAMLAAACSQRSVPSEDAPPESGGTVRIGIFEPLDILVPARTLRAPTGDLLAHVTPPLGRLDTDERVHFMAASRWRDLDTVLDFHLRPWRWEDGVPISPRDFILTSEVLQHPATPGPEHRRMQYIRAVEAVDDTTLRFRFLTIYPNRYRDALLMPMPAHVLGPQPDVRNLSAWPLARRPLSCGPFRVERSSAWELVLARNDAYGGPPARLDRVVVRTLAAASVVDSFRAGRVDVLDGLPVDQVERLRGVPDRRIVALVGDAYVFLGWNLRDARFADAAVRRAAAQAVDLEPILDRATLGQGDPARGPLLPAEGLPDTTAILAYDPAAARAALDRAGWRDADGDGVRERRGQRLAFHILVPESEPVRAAVADAIAADLERVGMRVTVRRLPLQEFLGRLQAHAFEAFMGRWFADPRLELDAVWHSSATDKRNYGGYASGRVDTLLTWLQHDQTPAARRDILYELQRRIYADQPYLFLYLEPRFIVFARRVRGAEPQLLSTFWNLPEWWIPAAARRAAGP